MYDNLHLHFRLPEPVQEFEDALANSPAFFGNDGCRDDRGRIQVKYRGMRIEYVPGEYWGRVRGSLHTFSHGSNVDIFSAAEAIQATTDLASSLGLPPEAFITKKLEAGVNIVVPSSPRPYLETLSHHLRSPFYALPPPLGYTRPLEYLAVHADYRLKYYDKGVYATRQGIPLPMGCRHLLRFEVVFTRVRHLLKLTGRTNLTLSDLAAPDVLRAVATYVLEQWKTTVHRLPLDYSTIGMTHSALLYAGADLAWWEGNRPHAPKSTFKKVRARYNQLQKQVKRRKEPHPYDLLLAEHMQTLCPDVLPLVSVSPKSGTILHTCNHVEFAGKGDGRVELVADWSDNGTRLLAA